MPYHNPTVKRATMAHHNLLELVGMCKFDAISTTNHLRPVAMNAKAGNYQGSGSENHARQNIGTRLDAGPGSFSNIKFGQLLCPSERNSCAARVSNLVQMPAGYAAFNRTLSRFSHHPTRLILGVCGRHTPVLLSLRA